MSRIQSKHPRSIPLIKTESPVAPIILVTGPPGSGKGTLCSRICEEYPGRVRHLSVGDYLRDRFCTNASEGLSSQPSLPASTSGCLPPEEIAKYVQESRLLPPETIIPLIKDKLLAENTSDTICWLLDGFPRDAMTAAAFVKEIQEPILSIELICDDSTARQRFLARRRTSSDNVELFDRRLKEYNENSEGISNHYSNMPCRISLTSGEVGWPNGAVESFKEVCGSFIDLTEPGQDSKQ